MSGGLWRTFDLIAQQRGPAPALLQGDRVVSFSDLRVQAARMAALLLRHGVEPGDRCLFRAANSPELAAAILGAWMIDAIVALVNDEAPQSHFEHAVAVTQPKIALADAGLADESDRSAGCVVLVLQPSDMEPATGLVGQPSHDLEPASIFFTSGSTGRPKGVTQNHATLLSGCQRVAAYLGLAANDRILCPIPWAFDYGYGQLLSTVLLGITQVLPVARNPFSLCEAIELHRPSIFAGLPSIFALLLRGLSPIRETDLGSIRLVTNTGGAIPPAIFADLRPLFAHGDISLNYGMTETYRSAGLPVELAASHPRSVGYAYPGVSLAVLRDDGAEAEPDELGEIVHRGAGVFMGYWGDPESTAKILRPDPLWTRAGMAAPNAVFSGDYGWKTRDGLLVIQGRQDRLIKSMGVRVSPDEVESILRETGLVSDVAVFGKPHEIIGEMVVAAVIPMHEGQDPAPELKALARQRMSQHMQPREYHLVQQFPLTPNGKTDFLKLRAQLTRKAD